VTSKDVIHNLCLWPMRAAQDATPGVRGHLWFTPTKANEDGWDIICGQLCGPGHSAMKAHMVVLPPKEFDAFIKEGSASAKKKAEAPPAAAVAATAPAAATPPPAK